jgi:hypothetical protein
MCEVAITGVEEVFLICGKPARLNFVEITSEIL